MRSTPARRVIAEIAQDPQAPCSSTSTIPAAVIDLGEDEIAAVLLDSLAHQLHDLGERGTASLQLLGREFIPGRGPGPARRCGDGAITDCGGDPSDWLPSPAIAITPPHVQLVLLRTMTGPPRLRMPRCSSSFSRLGMAPATAA